jgi:hypothetical protein
MAKIASLPVVLVTPINLNKGKTAGIQYTDNEFRLESDKRSEKINELFAQLDANVNDNSSILLYKEDVKRLADQLSGRSKSSKEIFDSIKQRLRANYHVLKLTFDPRTLQFNGVKTAFIVHKVV